MSDNTTHVLLVSADKQLRELVERHRPPGVTLRCAQADELRHDPLAWVGQLWLDLDSAPAAPLSPATRCVYFYAAVPPVAQDRPAGVYIRKPCTGAVLDVLWAEAATLNAPPVTPEPAPTPGLPAWLLELHELRLKELCRKCITCLCPRLGYTDASLYLHDLEQGLLTLAETNHTRPIDLAVRVRDDDEHLMVAVAQTGEVLYTSDTAGEYAARGLRCPDSGHRYPDGACLIAPLVSGDRLWGVLNLSGRKTAEPTDGQSSFREIFTFVARALHHARLYDRASTEARVDGLTGLYNYRWVVETVNREIRRAQRFHSPLALIMLDLDGLKTINDRHGHAAGDLVLRHVASRIAAALRRFDAAARVGGDEFIVLLPATDLAGARHVARRILNAIRADAPLFRNTPIPVTASVGAAQWEPDWETDQLIEATDRAMYQAKSQGRDRLVCRSDESATVPQHAAEAAIVQ